MKYYQFFTRQDVTIYVFSSNSKKYFKVLAKTAT